MYYGVFVLVSTLTVVLFQVCVCHLDMIGFRLTRLNTTLYTGGIKVRVSDTQLHSLELRVDPYPAYIYENAPANTFVLTVTGYENSTGLPLEHVSTTQSPGSEYFKLIPAGGSRWHLITAKAIDTPINTTFQFRVVGGFNGLIRDRDVLVLVSQENLYPPEFERPVYDFIAYRNSTDHGLINLGSVKAYDRDIEKYNSYFGYFVFGSPEFSAYFQISPKSGKIGIRKNFPSFLNNITFIVTAVDQGSPQKSGITKVNVLITDLLPPEIFCVSVQGSKARICWKDPTNGSYVEKYQLQFSINGQNVTSHPVSIQGKRNEVCTQVKAGKLQAGKKLQFTVKVMDGTNWSPESVQRFVNITDNGLYGKCPLFSECSVWSPCKNGGECKTNPDDLSYKCDCKPGWGGQNCTETDLCNTNPCINNGVCTFVGHNMFDCTCPDPYYGNVCQYRDKCSSNPCQNSGSCNKLTNGSFVCDCLPGYTGHKCESKAETCTATTCENGGICALALNKAIRCMCAEGYVGNRCEIKDLCKLNNPCIRGKCSFVGDNLFNCICDAGFVGKTCNETSLCHQGLCKNNGTCYADPQSQRATCKCVNGFYGNECQHYDKCLNSPCKNSGSCSRNDGGSFSCLCSSGFYGSTCERYNPCHSSPCMYNGTCTNTSDTNYKCSCMVERFGENCQFIDGCKLDICKNGASCKNTSTNGSVQCTCKPGYFGKFCENFDPCSSNPCLNASSCQNTSSTEYVCKCPPGLVGRQCNVKDPCLANPCYNKATCRVVDESFQCVCPQNFFGRVCEKYDFCADNIYCAESGSVQCNLLPLDEGLVEQRDIKGLPIYVTNTYNCRCINGYTGQNCESSIMSCDDMPCGDGRCYMNETKVVCVCRDGSIRDNCRIEYCPQNITTYDKSGRYRWPETLVGIEHILECPHGPNKTSTRPYASRKCQTDQNGVASWMPPDSSGCNVFTEAQADEKLLYLMTYTDDAAKLTPEMVANITRDLEHLSLFALDSDRIATEMATVISNLLEVRESVLIESNSKNHSSERLVELLTEYTDSIQPETNTSISTENIHLMVVNVPQDEKDSKYVYSPQLKDTNNSESSGVKMQLPKEVLTDTGRGKLKLQFISYRTSAFFIPKVPVPEEVVMKQRVLTAKLHGFKLVNLTSPIHFSMPNIEPNENHTCVYWDMGEWSTRGVYTLETGGEVTDCYTTHLTSFAVILDPSPGHALPAVHEKALTYISYIGCAVSIFGLAFTIVTYSMFRSLNRERSGKILLNMCVSMLLMNAAFILMAETTKSGSENLCIATAVLLHYFLLTSLMWMCTEAVNMYQALIKVFTKYSSYFILKRCIVAWGIPAIVVAITMGINNLDNYKSKTDFCYISHANIIAFYVSLLGPACLILVVNTVVFTLVARVIMKPRFKGAVEKSERVTPAQVRGAFTVMVLLGVTWVFGPVAIDESKIVFNYLFTILNSLQGFLIFVFRCLLNCEARMAWVLLIKTGTFKRRRGPMKASSDSHSSKAFQDSRLNATMGDSSMQTGRTTLSSVNGNHNGVSLQRNGNGVHHTQAIRKSPNINGTKQKYADDTQDLTKL